MVTLVNRAKVSTATTGTGTITLGAAESGYQSFADAGVVDTNVVRYVIEDGDAWEIGSGTYTAAGTTLTRTVSESSNADAAISLTGSAVVYVSATAADLAPPLELYAENPVTPTAPSATGTNAVSIGSESVSVGLRSMSLGDSYASGTDSFAAAIGNNAATYGATGANSVAIGFQAKASVERATSIGYNSTASGDHSSAYGHGANATKAGANAVGYGSTASGYFSNALGYGARAIGDNSVSLGVSYSLGSDSFSAAIGSASTSYGATGANSVAIGQYATATQTRSIAMGTARAIGDSSVAIALANTSALYSASGANSIAIGKLSRSSAASSVAIGESNNASGEYSFVAGGVSNEATGAYASTLGGFVNIAEGAYSVAVGRYARARTEGSLAHSSGRFSTTGDAQSKEFILRSDTTDATPEALTANNTVAGTTNQVILPNNSAYSFSGTIIARQQASTGSEYASWEVKGALLRDATAATTVLGNGIKNKLFASTGAAAWDIALTADTTNGGLAITVTGAAATNIRWVATVNTSEVTY